MGRRLGWLSVLAVLLALGTVSAAVAGEPEEGFAAIFNGKDLKDWDGNTDFWSVQDGIIHGETTKEKPTKGNTFCIWRGLKDNPTWADGKLEDFELRLSFRIQGGNSGVQYRSKDLGNWVVGGYQAEVCNSPAVGFLYGERMRGSLADVGKKTILELGPDGKLVRKVVETFADPKEAYANYKPKDWNDYRIVGQGNHLMQFINGKQTMDCTDNDEKGRVFSGILALQIHAGAPMIVEFKDIRLKKLPKEAEKPKE